MITNLSDEELRTVLKLSHPCFLRSCLSNVRGLDDTAIEGGTKCKPPTTQAAVVDGLVDEVLSIRPGPSCRPVYESEGHVAATVSEHVDDVGEPERDGRNRGIEKHQPEDDTWKGKGKRSITVQEPGKGCA